MTRIAMLLKQFVAIQFLRIKFGLSSYETIVFRMVGNEGQLKLRDYRILLVRAIIRTYISKSDLDYKLNPSLVETITNKSSQFLCPFLMNMTISILRL